MSGWSTPDPVMAVDGGMVDWLNEKGRRTNRFGLAYSRALIDNVILHKANDHDDVEPLLDMPARELAALLRGLNVTLPLQLHPWSGAEVIAGRGKDSEGAPGEEFYVPSGYRLLETVFTEFVGGRYIGELLCHLDAYAELYTFGVRRLDPEEAAWRISDASRKDWSEHLQRCYSRGPWEKEPWVDHELTSTGLERLRLYDSERRSLEPSQYEEFVQRVVGEDRDWPIASRPLLPCAELLAGGLLGYWEKNRVALSSEFRAAFIDGSRVGYAIGDDGSLAEIGRDWWQGGECTRLLHGRSFVRPDGVILEQVRVSQLRSSVEESVSASIIKLGSSGSATSPVDREVSLALIALNTMLESGDLAGRDKWHLPHLKKELVDGFYRRNPDPSCRTGDRPSDNAVARACKIFLDQHPELKPGPGRGPGS